MRGPNFLLKIGVAAIARLLPRPKTTTHVLAAIKRVYDFPQ